MFLSRRRQFYALCLCLLLSAAFLAGCGDSTTAAKPQPAPAPSPTKSIPTPTPTPEVPQQTYTNHNFSLSYPKAWTVKEGTLGHAKTTTFTAPGDSDDVTIITTGPLTNGLQVNLKTGMDNQIKAASEPLTNVEDTTTSPTITIGGLTWQQKSIRGDYTDNNDTYPVYYSLWGTIHPQYGAFYIMTYSSADNQSISQEEYFQPLVDSFKFTNK